MAKPTLIKYEHLALYYKAFQEPFNFKSFPSLRKQLLFE